MSQPDALIYAERVNTLVGPPGGGKTWVALYTCAAAIKDGHHVAFIDLEDHPASTFARMQALGCSDQEIIEQFHYCRPYAALGLDTAELLHRNLVQFDIGLVVIDSIGELLSLHNIKSSNDDDAVAEMYRKLLRPLVKLGCAVLLLDHVPKASNSDGPQMWAIGSQRKKAAIDGAAYMVEMVKPFAADTPGKIVLRTAKDRNGNFVVGSVAAEIEVTPSDNGDRLTLDVRAPQASASGEGRRQTVNMGRVSDYLKTTSDASAGYREIRTALGIHDRNLTIVLGDLVTEGWVNKYPGGPGKADRYCLIRPFDDLASTITNAVQQDEF